MSPDFYPMGVRISGWHVVVAGGGEVAARKIARLLEFDAKVTVVSPEIDPMIREWVRDGRVLWHQSLAAQIHFQDARLVFVATDDPDANTRLAEAARAGGSLVNRADDPADCDFILPSLCDTPPLQIALFTGGEAPALAKWAREKIEEVLGADFATFASLYAEFRSEIQKSIPDQRTRARVLNAVTRSEALSLLQTDGPEACRRKMHEIAAPYYGATEAPGFI